MRFLPTPDGLTIALHEHGGSGRPTLFCHATGFHGAVWEPLSAALGDEFERWAVDFRAHGASVVPPGELLPWNQIATDVTTTVDALEVPPGQLLGIGHSMGGACLLIAEQMRPGTFAGLWLFEPITPPTGFFPSVEGGNTLADGALRRRPSFPSHAEAVANFASKRPFNTLRADALHSYVRHGFVAGEDGEVHLACRPADESQVYRGGGSHHAFDRLGEVRCPVVIACSEEVAGPATFAPAVAAALPHGRLEVHRHMSHFGPLEAPTVLADAIRTFAAEL